jgi:acetyl-CoA decarbonylase/synthase complex subunit delta
MCAEEVWRAKETKSSDYPDSWGNLEDRALMWELMTASAFISAGTNIVVVAHPQSVKYFKKIFKEQ